MLCDGDLGIHCTCINGGSHLGVIDWSSGSEWYVWFLHWCWLQVHSDVVGGQWGIRCIFSSGKWVYWGLFVIIDFLQCGRQRWRMLSCWYLRWDWCDQRWCWSRCKSFWPVSECLWVGQGRKPSGLRSEPQVPVHGHAKQTAPFQVTGYTLLRRVGERLLSGWVIRPAKVH